VRREEGEGGVEVPSLIRPTVYSEKKGKMKDRDGELYLHSTRGKGREKLEVRTGRDLPWG